MQPSAPYGVPVEAVRPAKPATLTIAGWLGAIVGVLSILGPAAMFLFGRDSILKLMESQLKDDLGTDTIDPELLAAAQDLPEFDDAYRALVIKAVIGLVVGVLVLALALVARSGGTGARVGLAVALVVGMCAGAGLQLADMEAMPGATVAIAAITPLLSLVTIVLLFLPATNRYAAARKATARA